jgi:hypothetical protein
MREIFDKVDKKYLRRLLLESSLIERGRSVEGKIEYSPIDSIDMLFEN